MIDRPQINRALAKALAYHQCGKGEEAAKWAVHLVALLDCEGIVTPEAWGAYVASDIGGELV